jgi:nucleotide-binding universal stress UspA family protein
MPESHDAADLIVVGVDGSDASVDAARWAFEQARLTGHRLEVLTAWQWPLSWGTAMPFPTGYDPGADAQAMLDEIVDPLAESFPTVSVQRRAVEGHAAPVLIEASRHASLLVVASRGHGEVSGMLVGSVSLHCVTQAECPVLVYRSR